jgi:hypothetical protein
MRFGLVALMLTIGTAPAGAQWLDLKTPGIPRTADGKPNLTAPAPRGPDGKPDLSGVWTGPDPAPRIDPANAQTWVNDLATQRAQEFFKTRPAYACLPSGPEAQRFAGWKRVIQTPATIAILNDDLTYRVIFTDGRALEASPAPSWMGYSVARWEGDTLVVDSNGYNDKTWVSRNGLSHTEALRVRERYRRADFGHLEMDVTFTDAGAFAKPWGFTAKMQLAADTEMLESVCEHSSENWKGSLSDAASKAVAVAPDVLARYVGVYSGLYQGNKRTVQVTLSGDHLVATITGAADGDAEASTRTLVPRSQTLFEGVGLGYQFNVDDKGLATALTEIHISGGYRYPRQP